MESLSTRYQHLCSDLTRACLQAGRSVDTLMLLAVSKTRSIEEIGALAALGQRHFAENYIQEALPKIAALADSGLTWHFIGPVQTNKTRAIASHFQWLHSLDRWKVAVRLNDQRPVALPPLNVCIQVNVDQEDSKQGVRPEDVADLSARVHQLPALRLRGLMAIPSANAPDRDQAAFRKVATILSELRHTIPDLDTLSMGMSDDYPVAVQEGATMVRIGTALFGPRSKRE